MTIVRLVDIAGSLAASRRFVKNGLADTLLQ
jgi:hypothetical protein